MPFGLKNAEGTYQRDMTIILDGLLYEIVECYIDDIVVKYKSEQDHLKHLALVFECLRKHKLKMNPMKCAFEGRLPGIGGPCAMCRMWPLNIKKLFYRISHIFNICLRAKCRICSCAPFCD
jgi:hypothetical protein